TRRPTCEEQKAVPCHRRRARKSGQALDSPRLAAGLEVIAFEAEGARVDHFLSAGVAPNDWSAETAPGIRARCFPQGLARLPIQSQQRRVLVLVTINQHKVAEKGRGSARAIRTATQCDWQGMTPEFLALDIVGDYTKRTEITDYPVAIGGRRGRCWAVLGSVINFEVMRFDPP